MGASLRRPRACRGTSAIAAALVLVATVGVQHAYAEVAGTVTLDALEYEGPNDVAFVMVLDADLTSGTTSISVDVTSTTDATGIDVTLARQGDGSYTGDFGFTTGTSSDDTNDLIRVADGDTVTVTYADAAPSASIEATAVWANRSQTPVAELIWFTHIGDGIHVEGADGSVFDGATVTVYADAALTSALGTTSADGAPGFSDFGFNHNTSDSHPILYVTATEGTVPRSNAVAIAMTAFQASVLDIGFNSVAGAQVTVRSLDFSVVETVVTNADGVFRFAGLPAGTYELWAEPPDYGTYAGGSIEGDVTVTDRTSTSVDDIVLTARAVVGRVVEPGTSTPVANAWVRIHDVDYLVDHEISTDSLGRFAFGGLADGAYVINVEPPFGSSFGPSADTSVTVNNASGPADAGDVELTVPNLTGTVRASDGTTAVPDAFVEVRNDDYSYFSYAMADSAGSYRLTLPSDGTYYLTAYPPACMPEDTGAWCQDANSAETSVTFSGTPLTQNLTLSGPVLVGTVYDRGADGNVGGDTDSVVADAYVFAYNADFSQQAGGFTAADGTFQIGGLADGTYTVEVYPPWDRPDLLTTVVSNVNVVSPPVTVANSGSNLYFAVADKAIEVTVSNNGTPVSSGATVYAFSEGGGFAMDDTATGAPATYNLPVGAGTWYVFAEPMPGQSWVYAGYPKTVVVPDTANATESVTLSVTGADATITGAVLDPASDYVGANEAWVEIRDSTGIGNGGPTDATGAFSIAVPAGTYEVWVFPTSASYGSPDLITVQATSGTTAIGDLQLTSRDATIRGAVTYASGAGVSGASVFAWQPEGGGFADATTREDGTYTLNVFGGDWEVIAWPDFDDTWLYTGAPEQVTVASGQAAEDINFTVGAATGSLDGRVTLPNGNGASSLDGFVWAESSSGGGNGAPLVNGTYSIPLSDGTYTVSLYLAPGSQYGAPNSQSVAVSGETAGPTFQVLANDQSITGTVVNGTALTDWTDQVFVFATNAKGDYIETATAANGSYTLNLPAGTWEVGFDVLHAAHAKVGLVDSGGAAVSSTVTLSGSAVTRNLSVAPADQTISGTVRTSDNAAVPFAWVWVESDPDVAVALSTGVEADASGAFTINVPAGTYILGAAGDAAGIPPSAEVTVSDGNQTPASLTLQFRATDSTISGTVTANGSGVEGAWVSAWSESGGFVETTSGSGGAYSLAVIDNDTWHVEAFTETQASATTAVVLADGQTSQTGVNLALANVVRPDSVSRRFDASMMQVIQIGEVTLQVPAGALATSGQVTIAGTPLVNPNETHNTKPVGLGYRFEAFNDSGQLITGDFNRPLTITFPYDQAQVDGMGLTPQDLIPSYYDEATKSYRRIDNATVDTAGKSISFSVDHFTDFVVGSTSYAAPTVSGVSPSTGTVGTTVAITVTGTGFRAGAALYVGATAATDVSVASNTSLTATVPSSVAAGTYSVRVVNTDGKEGTRANGLTLATASSGGGGGGGGSGGGGDPGGSDDGGSGGAVSSQPVDAGGTVSTGSDATAARPTQATVRTPVAGTVSITPKTVTTTEVGTGQTLLNLEVEITAPAATAEEPLVLGFELDSSALAGVDLGRLVVYRNGVAVKACTHASAAIPDPCLAASQTQGDGDLTLTVRTSRASVWNFAEVDSACPSGLVPAVGFSDVGASTHDDAIDCAKWWGLVTGVDADTFRPSGHMTRAQAASIVHRLLIDVGVDLPPSGDRFTDEAAPHAEAIEALAAAGIVDGIAAGTYDPRAAVTRAQLAKLLVDAYEYARGGDIVAAAAGTFTDAEGHPLEAWIVEAAAAGFIRGVTASTFEPNREATRAQAASMIVNVAEKLVDDGLADPPI